MIVPFPVPACVTVHHKASLSAVQAALEVMAKSTVPEVASTFCDAGKTLNVGTAAAWVTVTITGVRPETLMVKFAVLVTKLVFS